LEGYGDDQRAEEYALQASQLYNELGLSDNNNALHFLSQIHLKRGEWRKAEQTALEALAVDDSEPYNTLIQYKVLAKVYAYLGNASKAVEYIDKLHELQSSWSNKNYQSAIREMEVKYETEKKEHEIERQQHVISSQNMQRRLLAALAGVLFLGFMVAFLLWRRTVQKRQHAETRIKHLEQEKQLIATQSVLDGETAERTRLARDLHDGLGGLLSALRLNLEDMMKGAILNADAAARFHKSIGILDQSMCEMRRVAHHLMPDALSRFGLKTALTDFCNTIPSAEFVYYGDGRRLDRKLEVVVYRIAHELINNSLKHSGASQIFVQIVQESARIALTVQDDGKGFDLEADTAGVGINNIRTRVASFGGTIDMRSSGESGTEINVEFGLFF
jgi:signal transduction histidine kinase